MRARFGEAWDLLFHPPIAHRGLWSPDGPPENSLGAFQAACAAGYGIELDVQISADGEAMVFHDEDLKRMTGAEGRLFDRTSADLADLRLAGTDEAIPTLAETLALIGHRAMVHIELKTPPGRVGPLEQRVHEIIVDHSGPLCVIGFNPYSHAWFADRYPGVLLRYADDLVVMCRTRRGAEYALETLRRLLRDLGLELKRNKTRIVHLTEDGDGLDFLGFHHRWVRGRRQYRHLRFLARWPSRKAMQRARDRIRELTARSLLAVDVERVVEDVNRFLRGWVGYFRYGNSARMFDKISTYARLRIALFVARRHGRPRSFGWALLFNSPNDLGLISLNGRVVAPRPAGAWREKPNASR